MANIRAGIRSATVNPKVRKFLACRREGTRKPHGRGFTETQHCLREKKVHDSNRREKGGPSENFLVKGMGLGAGKMGWGVTTGFLGVG